MKRLLGLSAGLAVVAACAGPAVGPSTPFGNATVPGASAQAAPVISDSVAPDVNQAAAAAYCLKTHGEVEIRRPVYGVNGTQLLFLSGRQAFCQYTRQKDGSRIHILLTTLYTTKPTLAALAYILKPQPSGSCYGNPASCYCAQLGGSDQFGQKTGAGGGWYKKNSIDQTLEACIFPDMSSIDSWGLAYHSQGVIRGANLVKLMRYKFPSSK